MTRLLVGNEFNEDLAGLADARRKRTGWWAQRLVWFAEDDDVLVMTVEPERAYLDYVTSLTGTRLDSLRLVTPPPDGLGDSVLTAARLGDPAFRAALLEALDGRAVDSVVALHPDVAVVALARALGDESAVPGHGFIDQGGSVLVNSKAAFRAVAGGVGVPVPSGGVCASREEAAALVGDLIEAGHPVILKHDLRAGGRGNEIVSPIPGIVPLGGRRTIEVRDRDAVHDYLDRRWDWLTSHGRSRLVVERYFPESRAVFAEFSIADGDCEFRGQGEMVADPMPRAEVIPAPCLDGAAVAELVDGGRRLCEPLRAMGYRGTLSADAIVTPEDDILFTEVNGRITGSTHIYEIVGRRIVGPDYAQARVLLEIDGWSVASFQDGVEQLGASGLAYDGATRTGIVLVMALNPSSGTIRYCAVGETLEAAQALADRLEQVGS